MIAYFSILAVSFLLFTFSLKIFRKPFHTIAEYSVAVVDALMSRLEEELKVQLVQSRMNKLLKGLFFGLLAFCAALLIGSIPLVIYGWVAEVSYQAMDFMGWHAILAISIGSTVGFMIPVKKSGKSDYSDLSKLLHRMILNHQNIAYRLFKRDVKSASKLNFPLNEKFIVVSGLARAGTTSFMNYLAQDNSFACLSYANMPFISAPSLWGKIYKPKEKKLKERSHKDGIKIGVKSNEALEEYFFKMLSEDAYIGEDSLLVNPVSKEDYEAYLNYQNLIKKDATQLYLAKNNNFMLHYEALRIHNSNFVFVVMFREPLAQATSLLEKHRDYSLMQEEDPFVLEYMNWLGHHEFGLNHKPFCFDSQGNSFGHKPNSIEYWLEVWINYYTYVVSLQDKGILFINYDDYCERPKEALVRVYNELQLKMPIKEYSIFQNKRKKLHCRSDELLTKATAIYKQLQHLSN